jgi:hypothetical protein
MQKKLARGLCALALATLGLASAATASPITYTDTHGDQVGSTNKARDIWSVVVDNDASNLIITINLDPAANFASANNLFNYGVGITTGAGAGGDTQANGTTHGNAYGRMISIDSSLGGMIDWIGCFGAGGSGTAASPYTSYGFNDYVWNGSAWVKKDTVASGQLISIQSGGTGASSVTLTVPMVDFTNLNLTPGTTIMFDVYSTGTSSGTAYDSVADASPTNGTNSGSVQYNGTVLDSYTIQAVPEPVSMGMLAMGALAGLCRRKRR